MSNEKKFKDLLARMVAMTPQPPPFPEEMTTVTQKTPTPRRNPALIFAVAAIAVVALAVPLLFLNDPRQPVGSGTSTTLPGPTTVPEPETTTTVPPTTTTTEPAESLLAAWALYLAQEPAEPGGRPNVAPFLIYVTESEGVPFEIVDSPEDMLVNLERIPRELPEGWFSMVPDAVEIVGKKFEQTDRGLNRVTLDMNEAFLQGSGQGLLGDYLMLNQLIWTTLQNDIDEVVFTVGGKAVTAFGAEGIDLTGPMDALSFAEEINTIILTSPVTATADEYQIYGTANVFEATLAYRVVDTDIEGFVTASCGTGCWGSFSLTIPRAGLPDDAVIEIYTHSAEDGRPIQTVRIPLEYSVIRIQE